MLLLSAASAWEIAVKYRLGKLSLPEPPTSYVPDRMRRFAADAAPPAARLNLSLHRPAKLRFTGRRSFRFTLRYGPPAAALDPSRPGAATRRRPLRG